ncbi:endonuclease/exonuclease/phosphatase family protein [Saccharopolyspora phatthalungensis]|uniref:Endonuclease/exonuclease/phosphatase (EEP) superfamily protein YafD n=1 Tax=Saccharopolyspora phatthalungensis TaxID=664693 RepID=A0A840Q2X0_9PSEU|nr:endonuclease/exonuclease/phosphatase family protein [Saccharopolyspora phatthalungensis]MBB5153941.1 endonuclease/exonuclease/phosphatase (EEP) superfamily protein YafD [Saccharopolyspora phatthalungensis]
MDQTLLAEPEQEEWPRRKPGGSAVTVLLLLAALGFLAWSALPLAGLDTNRYTVALVALTPYAALTGIVLALLCLVLRRWLTALIVAVVTATLVLFIAPRAVPNVTPAQGMPLRVLSVNSYLGEADATQLVDLVRQNHVDVLSLQELTPELVARLDAAGLAAELPYRVFRPGPKADGSGIAARHPLRELSLVPSTTLAQPSARLDLPGERHLEFVAVHPLYPMGRDTTAVWGRDLAALPNPADDGTPRILAGDFNATLDHTRLKYLIGMGYTDVAKVTGGGLYPTWPGPGTWFPPPVTIDHVLTSKGIAAQSYRTFDVAGSDHRAILATVVLTR